MALEEYRRKRDFQKTPEPAGAARARRHAATPLSFVIQKHAARRLHYDFRLELDGVLKSWAVPKGPSLDPAEKRLAVQVEDHPLDYGGFEGVIPEGQYGGGTVMLWDRGTWMPDGSDPDMAYRNGALKFTLDGEKLHGKWALIRMSGKRAGKNRENWLLIKERDDAAAPGSGDAVVEDEPLSVATGRSLDSIAAERDRVWDSTVGEVTATPRPKAAGTAGAARKRALARLAGARKAAMPVEIKPQLASLVAAAPAGPEWLHEIKFDGYRLLARIDHGKARLITRNGLDWTEKFPALARDLAALPVASAVLDGELVFLAPDGTTGFSELQDRIATGRTEELTYYVFDLIYLEGYDLTGAALEARKAALAEIIAPHSPGRLRYSDHQEGSGPAFLQHACAAALEGIVAKRRDQPYRPGRGDGWRKVKCRNRDEFVVIGFTEPGGSRAGLGSLLLGYYDPAGALRYAGRVGTGFDAKQLTALRRRLALIEQEKAPLTLPKGVARKGVHWVAPSLVAEVEFAGWTGDAVLRHASFQGLREDKSAAEVVYDPLKTVSVNTAPAAAISPARSPARPAPSAAPADPPAEMAPRESRPAHRGAVEFEGLRLSHPDRVLYPGDGVTKLDLAQYYAAVRDWALPHLANRPLSLVRCPEGHDKECFFQKHVTVGFPKAIGGVRLTEKSGSKTYPVIEDFAGLIGMVQLGVLEIHPWGSSVDRVEMPDRVTFDLDPDVGLDWQRVVEAALAVREALRGIGLESFVKTTGGKGLHVVLPLVPKLGWDDVSAFAKWVADRFAATAPEQFTTNMAKRVRTDRIYLDYLRNKRGATAIGTYSTRARAGAPVSTPLFWEEIEKGVRSDAFTVATLPARLAGLKSDPWAEIGTLRQSLSAVVRRQVGI